ncbi:MAG: gliding motility-associated C-terminal domain-containing protein [Bacteroidota bacterium]
MVKIRFFIGLLIILSVKTISSFAQQNNAIIFIENKGQWPEEVKFSAEIPGGMLFVENNSLTYSFRDTEQLQCEPDHSHVHKTNFKDSSNHYALKVKFLEAELETDLSGYEQTITNYNYFYGSDPAKWARGVRGYKKLVVEELYEGIDLILSSESNELKYDLKLKPGANPACIQMKYEGASAMELKNEDLLISTPVVDLKERIPASYALCDGASRGLESSYRLSNDVVSFEIGATDPEEAVVIDPILVFSTYSGTPSDNWGNTATFDEYGNGYTGGITRTDRPEGTFIGEFPATSGAYQTVSGGGWDVAILKFDSVGHNLLYATYLGGSGTEVPQSLVVNKKDELLILGVTESPNFPVTANTYDDTFNGGTNGDVLSGIDVPSGTDLFVAKLSSDGSQLLASTYIGGSGNDGLLEEANELARNYGDESRGDINFDSEGNVLIASRTNSLDFPIINGLYDTFGGGNTDGLVLKLTEDLDSIKWSTFLGGTGSDVSLSIKLDKDDNIFVGGGTTSADFPTTEAVYAPTFRGDVDGWVAHITQSGDSLIASTYVGTTNFDQVFFLDLDIDENVYLAGQTNGPYLRTSGPFFSGHTGIFLHKLTNNLQTTQFSTTLNQSGSNEPPISLTAFMVNDCDNIYIAGWGGTINSSPSLGTNNFNLNTLGLPITSDAHQAASDGSSFYLMVLSGDASELLYATHLGSSTSMVHVDGGTSRFDKHGIVYHSVCASCNENDSSFPTTEGAWAESNGSIGCNNALFKFDLASLRARIRKNSVALDNPGMQGGCLPLDMVFENLTTAGEVFVWDFGDGTTRTVYTKDTIVHRYYEAGTYNVRLHAFDPNTCIAEDFAYTSLTVSAPNFTVSGDVDICEGNSTTLSASGGSVYFWEPASGLNDPSSPKPIASPEDTTVYSVQIFNDNGCNFHDSLTVNVVPAIVPVGSIEQTGLCFGSRTIQILNESENVNSITWDMGDGTILDEWAPEYEYAADGNYTIVSRMENEVCVEEYLYSLNIVKLHVPNVLTRNSDGLNDVLKITSASPVDIKIFNRWGVEVYQQEEYNNDWYAEGLLSGIYYYEVVMVNGEICTGWIHLLDGN